MRGRAGRRTDEVKDGMAQEIGHGVDGGSVRGGGAGQLPGGLLSHTSIATAEWLGTVGEQSGAAAVAAAA